MRMVVTIVLIFTCIGLSFGQRRKKKSLSHYPLTIKCIDAYDMLPEEGVLLYIDDNLMAKSDSLGMLNLRLKRKSSSVKIALLDQDSLRVPVVMKEYLSDLANKYEVLLYPNDKYEAEIWALEDSIYGSVNKEEMQSDTIDFPIMTYSDSTAYLIGGQSELYEYLSSNIKTELFPETTTKVYMRFIVEKDGNLSHVITYNEVNAQVRREVVRVCRNMSKWHPSSQEGKPIRTMIQLPITIKF